MPMATFQWVNGHMRLVKENGEPAVVPWDRVSNEACELGNKVCGNCSAKDRCGKLGRVTNEALRSNSGVIEEPGCLLRGEKVWW